MNANLSRNAYLALSAAFPFLLTTSMKVRAATTLRIGMPPIPAAALPYFAQSQGFFAKKGIDAMVTRLSAGAATVAAVLGGSLDIGNANGIALAIAHERGLPLVYIAPDALWQSTALPTVGLVVDRGSRIAEARDVAGKVIGVNDLRNLPQLATMAWIDQNGGDASTVRWAELPLPALPEALLSRRVDAALLSDPYLSDALKSQRIRFFANCYEAVAKEFVFGGFFTTISWMRQHPDLVRSFQTAMRESASWANTHPALASEVLRNEKLSANAAQTFPLRTEASQLQPLVNLAARYGLVREAFSADDLIGRT